MFLYYLPMSGYFHTYPSVDDLDNNSPQHAWVITCEYIDDDGDNNWDTIVHLNHTDAMSEYIAMCELDHVTDVHIHPIDEYQYVQYQ